MATGRLGPTIRLETDAGVGILRFLEADRVALEKLVFRRYPEREWGTFFRFGYRRTGWGLALSFIDLLPPGPGDMDRQTDLTTFRDEYTRRAFRAAAECPFGIGVVHSHPAGFRTRPSPLDDDMDDYFARELAAYSGGAPYCSLILQRSEPGGLTFSGRICDRGNWISLDSVITVGGAIDRHTSELAVVPHVPVMGDVLEESTTARLEAVLGARSASRLRGATVGIVGCGGTGSPAAHVLARAGVGDFVFVDPERLGFSNLERVHGSYHEHVRQGQMPFKVELMRRMVLAINPGARTTCLVGNVLQENVLDELLRCDAVLGCVDSHHGRAALSDFARHYLLPVLDIGVVMDGADGTVSSQVVEFTRHAPSDPCAFCRDRIDPVAMSVELMAGAERVERERLALLARERGDDPDQYWGGRPRQLHTVGYLTTAAGALAAGYIEGWLTDTFGMPHPSFQFDLSKEKLGVVAPPAGRVEGCSCASHVGWADAARSFRNVAAPPHWSRRAVVLGAP
jgi:molybdopterin/thiamine biosynthesis adenylyltransferase